MLRAKQNPPIPTLTSVHPSGFAVCEQVAAVTFPGRELYSSIYLIFPFYMLQFYIQFNLRFFTAFRMTLLLWHPFNIINFEQTGC